MSLTSPNTWQDGGLDPHTTLNGGNLTVAKNWLILSGTLSGIGQINGSVNNGDPTGVMAGAGTVHPGPANAGGTLNIIGNYTQTAAGTLAIDATGDGAGTGFLNVQGNVDLDGALSVTRAAGYTPAKGKVLTFLKWTGTRTGDFATKSYTNNAWKDAAMNNVFFQALLNNPAVGSYSLVVQAAPGGGVGNGAQGVP